MAMAVPAKMINMNKLAGAQWKLFAHSFTAGPKYTIYMMRRHRLVATRHRVDVPDGQKWKWANGEEKKTLTHTAHTHKMASVKRKRH